MDLNHDRPLYGISVAAELTGVNPQMLRAYETRGLIEPHRTRGGTRRYSGRDLQLVERIATLLTAGINLAGVAQVLSLEAENLRLQSELQALRTHTRSRDRDDQSYGREATAASDSES